MSTSSITLLLAWADKSGNTERVQKFVKAAGGHGGEVLRLSLQSWDMNRSSTSSGAQAVLYMLQLPADRAKSLIETTGFEIKDGDHNPDSPQMDPTFFYSLAELQEDAVWKRYPFTTMSERDGYLNTPLSEAIDYVPKFWKERGGFFIMGQLGDFIKAKKEEAESAKKSGTMKKSHK